MFDIFCMQITGGKVDLPAHTEFTRWNGTHLDTIRRCVNHARTEYVWIVADCCDYANFDFTWQPVPWEADQIHCWASGKQQFGDTFLVPVSAFKKQEQGLKLLEWYEHINWHAEPYIPRVKWPTVTSLDEQTSLYAWHKQINADVDYEPSLWKKRDLHVFTQSGSVLLVPRDCKQHFNEQFYDYPYILRHNEYKIEEKPLDIVYLSNGEKNAEKNWQILHDICPRAKRIDGITGRAAAYKACAEISDTPWFFNVFAKCIVDPNFDFTWQPDWLQGPKHWIFHSRNPVNGLEYGHMGIIAYHKQMVLDATEWGLDFTLSARHGVVPVVGSTADFNTSPYETWRTAFRECIKLYGQSDPESRYRLNQWCSVGKGDYAEWSIEGATYACVYAASGNDLQATFEWKFLKELFDSKYNVV
jgi:hypothetical protein